MVFPEPGEPIIRTYQLACHRGEAHAIVMPNVTDALLDRFLADYLAWWRSAPQPHVAAPSEAPSIPLRATAAA